ncbi:MAG: hypothetical protein HRU25_17525 [Psychrobium sp.]|nr:hypothetical protein [Psychrobium sp.]
MNMLKLKNLFATGAVALSLSVASGASATKVSNITNGAVAEKLCKAQSEYTLTELALMPDQWRSESHNENGAFNIEGQWTTRGGTYVVECELPYNGSEELLTIKITKL